MIELLAKYDANLKQKNKRKQTPMDIAKGNKIIEILQNLEIAQENRFRDTIHMSNHTQHSPKTDDNTIIKVVEEMQANEKKGKDNRKNDKGGNRKNKGKQGLDSITENAEEKSHSPITKQ